MAIYTSKKSLLSLRNLFSGMKTRVLISVLFSIACISLVYADNNSSEIKNEKQFPTNIIIKHNKQQWDLSLTGLTIRKKFFLKIYSMAHYLELQNSFHGDDGVYDAILKNNRAKQISMIFLRSLTAEQIRKSLLSGIKMNSTDEEFTHIQPDVDKFMQAINGDVDENDEFILRWLPDGTLISFFQGEQISVIRNTQFARTLWSIWFGDSSVVDRKSLIKQLLTSS